MSSPGAPRRRGLLIARLAARIVLICVFIVLLALIAVRKVPAIAAAIGHTPSPAATTAQNRSTVAAPAPSAVITPTIAASATAAAPSGTATQAGGTTGGGTGSGGGVATTKPTATHAPTAPSLRVDSLSAPDVSCPVPSQAPSATSAASPTVTITWASTGADQAWFGVDTTDAKSNPYSQVDPDSSITINWPCPTSSEHYTVTVESSSGSTVSKTITVHNTGYTGTGG